MSVYSSYADSPLISNTHFYYSCADTYKYSYVSLTFIKSNIIKWKYRPQKIKSI